MKKLIFITFLISYSVFCQIDIKDTMKFQVFASDTLYSTHNNKSNALETFLILKKNGVQDVKILPFGKVEASITNDFFENKIDTFYIEKPLVKTTKDTLIMGVIANVVNESGIKSYGYYYVSDTVNKIGTYVKVNPIDSLFSGACNECKLKTYNMPLNLRVSYEGKYPVKYEEYKDSTFQVASFVRSQDSSNTYVQKYANEFWSFWKRESNSLDSLYRKRFVFISDNPGDGTGDEGTESLNWSIIRRHSNRHYFKYWQILAIRNDGYGLVMEVEENPLK